MTTHFTPRAEAVASVRTGKACRVSRFGGPDVIEFEDLAFRPPSANEVLVRVSAAGVSPWDAAMRAGRRSTRSALPLTLGAEFSGLVIDAGVGVVDFPPGAKVFGAANSRFTGAHADYCLVEAGRIARQPDYISDIDAAAAPIDAAAAWQALFENGDGAPNNTVMVLGAVDAVGACAVQLAHWAGLRVLAAARPQDAAFAKALGADDVVDPETKDLETFARRADLIVDCIGGATQLRAVAVLRRSARLVCVMPPPATPVDRAVRHLTPDVTRTRLEKLSPLIARGALRIEVGAILALASARIAHEMLEGSRSHARGKIVLRIAA
jgi:NADPH:quinone reductase-like Zn-dependent oxidoreductase